MMIVPTWANHATFSCIHRNARLDNKLGKMLGGLKCGEWDAVSFSETRSAAGTPILGEGNQQQALSPYMHHMLGIPILSWKLFGTNYTIWLSGRCSLLALTYCHWRRFQFAIANWNGWCAVAGLA